MIDRRRFLSSIPLTAALPSIFIRQSPVRITSNVSLVITGGYVISGDGSPRRRADVAIDGDRIALVAPKIDAPNAEVIDARDRIVSPGFIDIHSHTDLSLLINPFAESKLRQGVTTEVAGQDGSSIGPWTDDHVAALNERYLDRYDTPIDFNDLPTFFDRLRREKPAVNFASMIGAGTVRGRVIGNEDREATDSELTEMTRYVSEAIDAGACGLSSGLEYIPGAFATINELVSLCAPLQSRGLPYASHMRNEDNELLAAIEEAITIGQRAGVHTHVSHLKAQGQGNWWKGTAALEIISAASDRGLSVSFDRYPYVAYSTGLASLFPVWAREGGTNRFLQRLDSAEYQTRIREAVLAKVNQLGNWNSVQITSTGDDSLSWARGRKLGDLANERQEDPYELAVHLIRADRSNTGMVGFGMSEENTAAILNHPLGMICSDGGARATYGPLSEGTPHPRTYGSFPRVLGYYSRDSQLMPLEKAIHKMSGMPASVLGLSDRGHVKPGFAADIVIFDPDTIHDNASFENPHQYATGIDHVIVNGQTVLSNNESSGKRPGRVVTPAL